MDDGKIVDLYWQRDEYALKATNEKYGAYCGSIARRILQDLEDAEECVNDTWFHAWDAMPPHRPSKLSIFLGKITRELSLNRYKARFAQKRGNGEVALALDELDDVIADTRHTVEQILEYELVGNAISIFLKKQPERTANIFVRRYYHLCSIKQIASEFCVSESRIKTTLYRLRKQLRSYLESEGIL